MKNRSHYEYDAIVVGSGPGGATIARELAKAGKTVLILERGKDHRNLGKYKTALSILDKKGLGKTKEGMPILRALTTGGTSVIYSASAALPPPWLKTKYGVDTDPWIEQAKLETWFHKMPESLMGEASRQVMETANKIGFHWEPNTKHLDQGMFIKGRCCGANTHLGCTCGAKWTAREYLKQALEHGANLLTEAMCKEVIVENGKVKGVAALHLSGKWSVHHAKTVIVAAGGIGTPALLHKVGIEKAGEGCFMDPTVVVYGETPKPGIWQDPPVSVVSWEFHEKEGIRMGTIIEPRAMMALSLARKSPLKTGLAFGYKRTVGILIKAKDDLSGRIYPDGKVSKPLTDQDRKKLDKGVGVAREILKAMGCKDNDIGLTGVKGVHPSGTCRIGHVVDTNLATEVDGLYVCDASVFPEALDRPTVLTIVALGKRLAAHLLGK